MSDKEFIKRIKLDFLWKSDNSAVVELECFNCFTVEKVSQKMATYVIQLAVTKVKTFEIIEIRFVSAQPGDIAVFQNQPISAIFKGIRQFC